MKKIQTLYYLLSTICFLHFTGCSYIEPLVRDVNLVSVEDEKQLGVKMDQSVRKEMTVLETGSSVSKVRSIGNRLAATLPHRDFDYQFYVVQDDTPNAFAIPGGKIYIHTGLISFVDNDDELAGVIAHELGHAYERHPAKGLTRAYGMDYLAGLITNDQTSAVKKMSLELVKTSMALRYTRGDETEADELSYAIMKKAGYSTKGLTNFLKKLDNLSPSNNKKFLSFLSTHPVTADRIAHLEAIERGEVQLKISGF